MLQLKDNVLQRFYNLMTNKTHVAANVWWSLKLAAPTAYYT